jgi:hypothetical protein
VLALITESSALDSSTVTVLTWISTLICFPTAVGPGVEPLWKKSVHMISSHTSITATSSTLIARFEFKISELMESTMLAMKWSSCAKKSCEVPILFKMMLACTEKL